MAAKSRAVGLHYGYVALAVTSSFYMSFYVAALVEALGIVSALLLRRPKARL